MFWRIRSLIRNLLHGDSLDSDLAQELRAAAEELARRYERGGMTPEDAARRANIDLGGLQQLKEATRDVRVGTGIDAAWCDVRLAARGLQRSPAFASAVILTFAIGIGANTAIFSVVKQLLLDPLPYPQSERLVFVWSDLRAAGYPRAPLAGAEFKDLRERTNSFEQLAAIWANTVALTDGSEPEQLRIGLVTANFFAVLGVEPSVGRSFSAADEEPGAPPSILLSSALWKRRFGADPGVVGRKIAVNGVPTLITGVMPDSFRVWMPPDAALPADLQAWRPFTRTIVNGPRSQQYLRVIGRLRPGVSVAAANDDVAAVGREIGKEHAEYVNSAPAFSAVGLHRDVTRDIRPALFALFAGVSVLMLLACANVANLLIARATARQAELGLRSALGASRFRLFQQAAAEALVLATGGAVFGVGLAAIVLRGLVGFGPDALRRLTGELDFWIAAFVAVSTLAWAMLVSVVSSRVLSRTDRLHDLLAGARASNGTVASRLDYRVRAALVSVQVAISVVLLISGGLLTRTFIALQTTDLGFSTSGALTFRIAPSPAKYTSPAAINAFNGELQRQLAQIPGVTSVGAVSHLPFDNLPNWSTPYRPAESPAGLDERDADARTLAPGYLSTVGATLLAGRDFTTDDSAGRELVVIVDERLARRAWPGEAAVGKLLRTDPGTTGDPKTLAKVVGVIKHMRHRSVATEVREQLYFSQRQVFRSPMAYVIRGDDPAALAAGAKRVVASLDPALPVFEMRPLDDYLARALSVSRFTTGLAVGLSMIGVALAVIGIYGVLAYSVSRRQAEMAVRMAVGATRTRIVRLVFREAVWIVSTGAAAGVGAALLVARYLEPQLHEVSPYDLSTYAVSLALIMCVGGLAAAVPAFRVTRMSVLFSLREG